MTDFTKSVGDVKNYTVNWASETTDQSDTLATSSFAVPSGITLDSDTNTTTTATCLLSGGRHGVTYAITNTVTTTTGALTLEQSFTVKIDDYPSVV